MKKTRFSEEQMVKILREADRCRRKHSLEPGEVLTKLVSLHGAPTYLRSDNGPDSSRARSCAVRPHSSLNMLTPIEFKQQLLTTHP